MSTMEFLLLFAGSGGWLVAIINIIGNALAARRARKEKLEDRELEREDSQDSLEAKFEAFVKKQETQNASIRQRLEGVEAALALNTEVNIAGEYTAIRKEACSYIKQGSVDPVDRAELKTRYARYLLISKSKDKSLDKFIDEVDRLRAEPVMLSGKED